MFDYLTRKISYMIEERKEHKKLMQEYIDRYCYECCKNCKYVRLERGYIKTYDVECKISNKSIHIEDNDHESNRLKFCKYFKQK